MIFGSVAK